MRSSRVVGIVLAGLALLAVIVLAISAYQIARWSEWANRVMIVQQSGSDEKTVVDIMGKPWQIVKPGEVDMGFTPRPVIPRQAVKVYVYSRHYPFIQPAEYWEAVVFVDRSGRVVGGSFGHS